MGLGADGVPAWFGGGWLITLTVVWALASLWVVLWYGAMAMDPRGHSLPDGPKAWVYGLGAILIVYVAPLWLGWTAHAKGNSLWVCLLYLVPHGLTGAFLGMTFFPRLIRRRAAG